MVSYTMFKTACRRDDYIKNLVIHPFSARVSTYFSYIFYLLNLTPNFVTFLIFCCGIVSAFFYSMPSLEFSLIGFLFYRMHIILDVCDGELARFTKKYSRWGLYWDQLIHFFIYPLIILSIIFSLRHDDNFVLYFIALSIIFLSKVIDLASKNVLFRQINAWTDQKKMIVKGEQNKKFFKSVLNSSIKNCFPYLLYILSYDAFMLFYIVALVLEHFFLLDYKIVIVIGFSFLMFSVSILKSYLTTKNQALLSRKNLI